MKAKLILCEGTQENIEFKSFKDAIKMICQQGYYSPLEIVYLNNHRALLIDEEGKIKNLPMNATATAIAHDEEVIFPSDFICGDVILIEDLDEFEEIPYE